MKASDLIAYVEKAYSENWGYVLTGQGEYYTKELAEDWISSKYHYPHAAWTNAGRSQRKYFTVACAKWYGHYVADCSGLIVAAFRTENSTYQDQTANTFKSRFKESGKISTLPEISGLALWRSGHIGVYIGDGWAIEARGYSYGVVKTKVADRTWTHWGKLADIEYEGDDNMLYKGMNGPEVQAWQESIMIIDKAALPKYGADGDFGGETEEWTGKFQADKGLPQTGKVDNSTAAAMWIALIGNNEDSARVDELESENKKMTDALDKIKDLAVNYNNKHGADAAPNE